MREEKPRRRRCNLLGLHLKSGLVDNEVFWVIIWIKYRRSTKDLNSKIFEPLEKYVNVVTVLHNNFSLLHSDSEGTHNDEDGGFESQVLESSRILVHFLASQGIEYLGACLFTGYTNANSLIEKFLI